MQVPLHQQGTEPRSDSLIPRFPRVCSSQEVTGDARAEEADRCPPSTRRYRWSQPLVKYWIVASIGIWWWQRCQGPPKEATQG